MIAVLGQVLELKLEDGNPDRHAVGAIGVEAMIVKDEDLVERTSVRPTGLSLRTGNENQTRSQKNLVPDTVSHSQTRKNHTMSLPEAGLKNAFESSVSQQVFLAVQSPGLDWFSNRVDGLFPTTRNGRALY